MATSCKPVTMVSLLFYFFLEHFAFNFQRSYGVWSEIQIVTLNLIWANKTPSQVRGVVLLFSLFQMVFPLLYGIHMETSIIQFLIRRPPLRLPHPHHLLHPPPPLLPFSEPQQQLWQLRSWRHRTCLLICNQQHPFHISPSV